MLRQQHLLGLLLRRRQPRTVILKLLVVYINKDSSDYPVYGKQTPKPF